MGREGEGEGGRDDMIEKLENCGLFQENDDQQISLHLLFGSLYKHPGLVGLDKNVTQTRYGQYVPQTISYPAGKVM